MIYIVTDHDNKDRESPIVDTFDTREAAEVFAAEYSAEYGDVQVEEWESLAAARGE